MRRILYGDIVSAAAVLRCVASEERRQFLDRLMYRAHCADKIRKRFGRSSVRWGNGTLEAACAGWPRRTDGFFGDPDYAECMRLVFSAILKWRRSQRRQARRRFAL